MTTAGASVPTSVAGGGAGDDPVETIATTAFGGSAEFDLTGSLFGHDNSFVIGDSFDWAYTGFASNNILSSLTFQPGGVTAVPMGKIPRARSSLERLRRRGTFRPRDLTHH